MAGADSSGRIFWRVLGNAAVKPVNLLVLAVMLAAAVLVQPWIAALAVPIYAALVTFTVRDPHELDRIASAASHPALQSAPLTLDGISGSLRDRVQAALAQEAAILEAITKLPVAPDGLADQVRTLGGELVETARRASDVDSYLDSVDVADLKRREAAYRTAAASSAQGGAADAMAEQLQVIDTLTTKRRALDAEIDHVEAGLGTIRARLVQARADAVAPSGLASEVNDLRDRMRALAQSLGEAYGQEDPSQTTGTVVVPEKGA